MNNRVEEAHERLKIGIAERSQFILDLIKHMDFETIIPDSHPGLGLFMKRILAANGDEKILGKIREDIKAYRRSATTAYDIWHDSVNWDAMRDSHYSSMMETNRPPENSSFDKHIKAICDFFRMAVGYVEQPDCLSNLMINAHEVLMRAGSSSPLR